MSALEGLSVANNDLATNEVFFADQNQAKLNKTASHLASGLSIQSPADDPARYSQAKHTEVAASSLDEASADLQNTQNALTVASAALSTITDIVQRMRVLCVAANNTTLSPSDVANIQDEIGQLNTQVNTICANTQFNGTPLFKSTSVVTAPPTVVQTVDTYLSNPTASEPNSVSVTLHSQPVVGDVLIAAVAHDDGYGGGGGSAVITPPAGWTLVTTGDNGFNDGLAVYEHVVTETDPLKNTFTLQNTIRGRSVNLDITELKNVNTANPVVTSATQHNPYVVPTQPDPSPTVSAAQVDDVAIGFHGNNNTNAPGDSVGSGWTQISQNYEEFNSLEVQLSDPATTAGQSFTSNLNFYPGGVGDAYGAIALLAPGTEQQPSTFSTSTGAQEGDLLNVTVQGFTSAILGLSSIDVTQSATAGEGFCDNALTTLLTQQDMLGSAISAAADYAQNNELTSTNLIAAASSIQDLNVAQASTQYDKEEMLAAFTTTLISQSSNLQKSLLQLFR